MPERNLKKKKKKKKLTQIYQNSAKRVSLRYTQARSTGKYVLTYISPHIFKLKKFVVPTISINCTSPYRPYISLLTFCSTALISVLLSLGINVYSSSHIRHSNTLNESTYIYTNKMCSKRKHHAKLAKCMSNPGHLNNSDLPISLDKSILDTLDV